MATTPDILKKFEDKYLNDGFFGPHRVHTAAIYGFLNGAGNYIKGSILACHGGIGHPGTPGITAVVNLFHGGLPEVMKQWLVDKEVSPWRALMQKDFHALRTEDDELCVIIGDIETHSAPLIMSYVKAARIYSECPAYGTVMTKLLEKDVHPTVAFFMASIMTANGQSENFNVTMPGWHGCCFNKMGRGTLENLVLGNHKAERVPYIQKTSYYGCDDIFSGKGDFDRDFTQKFGIVPIEIKRKFGSPVMSSGWTLEKTVEVCKQLEKDYDLEAYRPAEATPRIGPATESVPRRKSARVRANVGEPRVRANKAA